MESIIQAEKECFVCKTTQGLHSHHIMFGVGHRELSEKYGLKVWLFGTHHNLSNEGVHVDKEYDLYLRRLAQQKFEEKNSREEWMEIFKKDYLE